MGPLLLLAAALAGAAGCGVPAPFQGFEDVASAVGLAHSTYSGSAAKVHIRESLGQGACWIDHDHDGDSDLLVLNGAREVRPDYTGAEELFAPWRFYENLGGRFSDATARVGLEVAAWGVGCATGDVDGDGLTDLFVTTAAGPNRLFLNRGGRFEESTRESAVGERELSASAAFGDLDGDGDLDLFVTTYLDESRPPPREGCNWKGTPVMCGPRGYPMLADRLYLNDGGGIFSDASAAAGIGGHEGFGLGVVLFDADDDRDLDVYVSNDSSPNHLFLNQGAGSFVEGAFAAGVALSEAGATQAGMGVDAADLDGDGRLDLVVTNFSDDVHNFYRAEGGGWYTEWSPRTGLAAASFQRLGWAVLAEDFDLDGDLDLLLANGHVFPEVDAGDPSTSYRQPVQLLLNDGRGRLRDAPEALRGNASVSGRGAATADFDGDGDLDALVTRDGEPPMLWRNSLPASSARWLRVRLRGRGANTAALGARVVLETAGGRRQVREVRANRGYLGASEPVASFGLGETEVGTARLTVRWPRGAVRTLFDPPLDRELLLPEPAPAR